MKFTNKDSVVEEIDVPRLAPTIAYKAHVLKQRVDSQVCMQAFKHLYMPLNWIFKGPQSDTVENKISQEIER